ncbi:MSMEG_6728 family protein [Nocardioides sp. zg-1228]|uniref:MSMEG_6728 family protein n=1 Tax=Nocardioides sp. zg-1228 TaxID=2763008 RepID=UPI0016435F41|nr:MSMEG_6728 family protein [Nocardioides sp. zg-1228]MBC2933105.1 MSMEG_6728 family protein [Nocardioides sp. zg-1228]QSF56708.1 MSMEG_6728 family protein [Nocardioides sp. zg-1228]
MQTFLPYPDFEASARALDQKRLGKQRVETIQVVRALTVPGYGWANHPATLMWKGHEEALGRYGLTCCVVWLELGFGDTCAATIAADLAEAGITSVRTQPELAAAGALPAWLGDPALHLSHRSALVRKDPDLYRERFPGVPDDLPYAWPVRSPAVLEAERRREETAARREQRAAERLVEEAERARRRRSRAAKKGWRTRRQASTEDAG